MIERVRVWRTSHPRLFLLLALLAAVLALGGAMAWGLLAQQKDATPVASSRPTEVSVSPTLEATEQTSSEEDASGDDSGDWYSDVEEIDSRAQEGAALAVAAYYQWSIDETPEQRRERLLEVMMPGELDEFEVATHRPDIAIDGVVAMRAVDPSGTLDYMTELPEDTGQTFWAWTDFPVERTFEDGHTDEVYAHAGVYTWKDMTLRSGAIVVLDQTQATEYEMDHPLPDTGTDPGDIVTYDEE